MRIKQNKMNVLSVIIGRLLIYTCLYAGIVGFCIWAFSNITVYR